MSKPIVWLHGEIKTPPFSANARIEAGLFLRRLQEGENITMPFSKPMKSIGKSCHELRIEDKKLDWRIIYHIADDAIVILEIFPKKTKRTPTKVIKVCRQRLTQYYSV